MADTKFCLNCGGMFDKNWNKRLEAGYLNKDCCCKKCEITYHQKQMRRGEQVVGKHKHGVMS